MKFTEKYTNLRSEEVKSMSKQENKKSRISKNTLKTAKRLLKYVTETYKVRFILVFICILISSVATISVSLSLKFTQCSGMYFPSGSYFYLYLYKDDGLHRTGCFKKSEG